MDWSEAEPPERPDLYVVARFLDRLVESSGTHSRTRLQSATRLNYDLYRSYLSLLLRKGYVEITLGKDGQECVRLTHEGSAAHDRLVGWIRDAFGEIRL